MSSTKPKEDASGEGCLRFRFERYYGREYSGRPDSHPYELLLAMDGIEHRTTKIRSPRIIDFVERLNRTLFDKSLQVTARTSWYGPTRCA